MSYLEALLIETLASDVSANEAPPPCRIGLYVDGVPNAGQLRSLEEAERRWGRQSGASAGQGKCSYASRD